MLLLTCVPTCIYSMRYHVWYILAVSELGNIAGNKRHNDALAIYRVPILYVYDRVRQLLMSVVYFIILLCGS